MTKSIFLIRHGESEHNSRGNSFSGISDIGINQIGIEQCEKLSRLVEGVGVSAVYSSPLSRARTSARIVFPNLSIHKETIDWFSEIDYGEFEGLTREQIDYHDVLNLWDESPSKVTFPGGNSVREHSDRVYSSFIEFTNQLQGPGHVACVGHRTTIRLLVASVLGLHIDQFRRIPCSNCSITEVAIGTDGRPFLRLLNLTTDPLRFE